MAVFSKVVSVEEAVEILKDKLQSDRFVIAVKENDGIIFVDTQGLKKEDEVNKSGVNNNNLLNLF
jgi:hypothetical protein